MLWADCDGEDAVAALQEFETQPSIVIASRTGNNCHAYWPLTGSLPREEVEPRNREPDPATVEAAPAPSG